MHSKIKKTVLQSVNYVTKFRQYIEWLYQKKSYNSVYFYTFPKCASTLFSSYVLKNVQILRHVDYGNAIYNGKFRRLIFEEKGFIYRPIRIFHDYNSTSNSEYNNLVKPTSNIDFIQDKIATFFIRYPRDILVSNYYSLAYSHQFSPVPEIAKKQLQERKEALRKTVDQYVLDSAEELLKDFETLYQLTKYCNQSVVIKYEDMINNWDYFAENLTKYIEIRPDVLQKIYQKSRPVKKENKNSHRRSGKTEQFKTQLENTTIFRLNKILNTILTLFNYKI